MDLLERLPFSGDGRSVLGLAPPCLVRYSSRRGLERSTSLRLVFLSASVLEELLNARFEIQYVERGRKARPDGWLGGERYVA